QRNLAMYNEGGALVPIEIYTSLSKPQVTHVCGTLQSTVMLVNQGRLMGDAAVRCLLNGQRLNGIYTRERIEDDNLYQLTPATEMYARFRASLKK
ncbi:MAG: hypothetical protein AABX98_06970, partial [Nanoarchaeota archaeon]